MAASRLTTREPDTYVVGHQAETCSTKALEGLAVAADKCLQTLLATPPTTPGEEQVGELACGVAKCQEFQMELAQARKSRFRVHDSSSDLSDLQVRRQFQVRDVPPNVFQQKAE